VQGAITGCRDAKTIIRTTTVKGAIRDIMVKAVEEELLEDPEIQMMIALARRDPEFKKNVLDELSKD